MLILASTRHQTASSTWFHINRFGGSDWIPQVEKSWWQAIDFLKRLYFLSLIATADSEHLCVSHAKACAVGWWILLTRDRKTLTSWLRFALNEFSCVYILSTPSPLLLVGWGIGTEARCLHLQMLRCITEVCLMLLTTLLVEFQATLCARESNDSPFGTFSSIQWATSWCVDMLLVVITKYEAALKCAFSSLLDSRLTYAFSEGPVLLVLKHVVKRMIRLFSDRIARY